jgi:acyl dehydratase
MSGLDALADACPVDLGSSAALVVTQEMVDTHAATTGDAQWIHNDPERARTESPFGGPIVQGFLLLALLTRLSAELTFPPFGPVEMLVNYGFDRVRFVEPVPVGAAVVLSGRLVEVRPRDVGRAVLAIDVELRVAADGDADAAPGRAAVAATWLFLAVAG